MAITDKNNAWMGSFGLRVGRIMKQVQEYHMQGGYGGNLNLMEIVTMFKSATTEIQRLQNELNAANAKIHEISQNETTIEKD